MYFRDENISITQEIPFQAEQMSKVSVEGF